MVYTTYLWGFWGWFIIAIPSLKATTQPIAPSPGGLSRGLTRPLGRAHGASPPDRARQRSEKKAEAEGGPKLGGGIGGWLGHVGPFLFAFKRLGVFFFFAFCLLSKGWGCFSSLLQKSSKGGGGVFLLCFKNLQKAVGVFFFFASKIFKRRWGCFSSLLQKSSKGGGGVFLLCFKNLQKAVGVFFFFASKIFKRRWGCFSSLLQKSSKGGGGVFLLCFKNLGGVFSSLLQKAVGLGVCLGIWSPREKDGGSSDLLGFGVCLSEEENRGPTASSRCHRATCRWPVGEQE